MHLVGPAELAGVLIVSARPAPAVSRQADAHIAKAVARARAAHDDHLRAHPRIGPEKRALHFLWRHELRLERIAEALRDAHAREQPARQPVVGGRLQSRACPVQFVLVDDEAARRHDVEHAVDHGLRHEGLAPRAARLGVSLLILRPQPMQHEAVAQAVEAGALLFVAADLGIGAMCRAPRHHQRVVVELAGDVLLRLGVEDLARPRDSVRSCAQVAAAAARANRASASIASRWTDILARSILHPRHCGKE